MNKIFNIVILIFFVTSCSFNKNSEFWTSSKTISQELKYKKIFEENKSLEKELNSNLKINLNKSSNKNYSSRFSNNDGRVNYSGNLKKSSRYKFSKIENFYQFEPTISFDKKDIIFFDNKGTILKFNDKSKLVWKKNHYSKSEKKLNPVLQFANNERFLIVTDNIAKYYMIDLKNGNLIWTKKNVAPFNSQIKIYKDKFFVIDFLNILRCFSIKNGKEIWNVNTESTLIRSQKRLSIAIENETLYFNNSLGDISAVNIDRGELLWQLPTQSSLIYQSAFSLETSDLISDSKSLFFSNNRNQFFSVDLESGSFNWENKINSNVRPTVIDNLLFTVSIEGYLIILEKKTGNIIRVTDIFKNFKNKDRNKIKPSGFIVGKNNIYLSTNHGRLLVIDTSTGQTISTLKIDNQKISRPFILDKNLFVVKDNAIIKLN